MFEKFSTNFERENAQNSTQKIGFTLAEVLITLGIIGVVAALTLPTLIQNYKNQEVESKLQKIYTVMNQAIAMSEIDNGPKEHWNHNSNCVVGKVDSPKDGCKQIFEKYFLKYLKYLKFEELETTDGSYTIGIWMNDSSLLIARDYVSTGYTLDFYFYPNAKNFTGEIDSSQRGISSFLFGFYPNNTVCQFHYKKGFEPYSCGITEYTKESLTVGGRPNYGCNKDALYKNYCTALIYLNGWKIPKDYPFKVK